MSPIGKAARNERVKLTASSLNTLGLACAVSGGVIPAIGFFLPDGPVLSMTRLAVSLLSVMAAVMIHLGARALLRRLEE